MINRININEWAEQFKLGSFSKDDVKTQIKAGWYDWFCKDSSLKNKTQRMGRIICQ